MTYKLGRRSLQRLGGVNNDLVAIVKRAIAISDIDFTVLEGMRTLDRQKKLLASGASTTLNSRHLDWSCRGLRCMGRRHSVMALATLSQDCRCYEASC